MGKKKPKVILEASFDCPHCKKHIKLKRYEETLTPAVKADKKTWVKVEKDTQTKLKTGANQ